MTFPRPSTGLVAILATSLLAPQAHAQNYRPDAEGYPCAARGRLAIVQDDQGYSIRHEPLTQVDTAAVTSVIPIGAALTVDAKIFALAASTAKEASHAPRR